MDIVACTDKRNVMPTGVMMISVCENNPEVDIHFHLVTDTDVSTSQCNDLKELLASYKGKAITFYPIPLNMIDNQFPNIDKRIPRTAYYRLFLSALLPEKVDKVLYFDGDIIVRHSLTELWNTDVSGHALAAVPDMREGVIDRYNRLKYSPSWGYFNSGMLLINLKYWREHHALERFLDCIQKHHAQLVYHDQDVLNDVFHEQKIMLPIKFNFQHGHLWKEPLYDYWKYEQQVLEARKDPVIIHYTGGKPWTKYIKYHNPYSSSFYKYQNLSKWRGIKVDNRSIYTKIRTAVDDVLRWMKIRPDVKNNFIDINPID